MINKQHLLWIWFRWFLYPVEDAVFSWTLCRFAESNANAILTVDDARKQFTEHSTPAITLTKHTHTHTHHLLLSPWIQTTEPTHGTNRYRKKQKKKILIIWCRRQNLLFPPFRNHLSIHSLMFYYFAVLVHWHNTIIRRHKTDNYHTNTSTRTMTMCCTTQHRWI